MVSEEGFQAGTTGKLHGLQGRPVTQEVAEDRGVFVLQPVQHLREIVLKRAGEAMRAPDFVTYHAAAVGDELCERPHRGALRREGEQLVARGQQEVELEFGISGIVFGPAGRKGCAIPRPHERLDGEEDEKVILAQGGAQGTLVEFEADSKRLAVEPCAPRGAPRVNGLRRGLELKALPFGGASRLETPIMFRIGPVAPNTGSKCVV
jgi:hypothetical protein